MGAQQPTANEVITCKYCQSSNVIKWGQYNGVPRYWCKSCRRKFAANKALPRMSTPIDQVADAVHSHYEGMSLDAITRNIEQQDNVVSDAAIFKWIDRFTDEAIDMTRDLHPKVGGIWIADETVLTIAGRKVWLFDIMDSDTRFLLAARLAFSRTADDAQSLMEEAARRAGKVPRAVVTDKLSSYLDGIDLAFGGRVEHRQGGPFKRDDTSTSLIERLHGSIKARTKVMRGLKSTDSAMQFVDGWAIHYNYFRPHSGLDGKRPAEAAGINLPCKNWGDLVRQSKGRVSKSPRREAPHYKPPKVPPPSKVLGQFTSKGRVRITQRPPRITPPVERLR